MTHGGDSPAGGSPKPPLAMGLRLNLSVMMFLQFAVWGAWFVVFVPYLRSRGLVDSEAAVPPSAVSAGEDTYGRSKSFTDMEAAVLFGNMALGAIITSLFAG